MVNIILMNMLSLPLECATLNSLALNASLTFCLVALWPWNYCTALPPPPHQRMQDTMALEIWSLTLEVFGKSMKIRC